MNSGRLSLCGLLLLALPVHAQNFQRGQELFEHHCLACHHDFERTDSRHVRSLAELRRKIEAWASHTNVGWRKTEIGDVLYYINKSFYHFPQKTL